MSSQSSSACSSNLIQRDRFELLSAYLDGEVTAAERKQVEEWLVNDQTVQRLHERLLKLRHSFQTMPVPLSSAQTTEETVNQVLARVDRQPKLSLIWGGAAIAALFVGALVNGILPGSQSPLPEMAKNPQQTSIDAPQLGSTETLLVALDKPLVDIPKTPVVVPNRPLRDAGIPSAH